MDLVLGIDLGTSYFKLGLFDRQGNMRGLGRVAVATRRPAPEMRELAVDDFLQSLRQGLGQALDAAQALPRDIRALAYSSQANTFALLDANDRALTPFILWNDTRANPVSPKVEAHWNRPDFLERGGQDWRGPEFAIAKIEWLRSHAPELWQRARRIAFLADYLVYALTGRHAGDGGSLSLTGLYCQDRRAWWPEALEGLDLDAAMLPEPLLPGTLAAPATTRGAQVLGITPGTPVVVGSLDHHAAALGAGLASGDEMSESTGTVVACLHLLDRYAPRSGGLTGPGVHGRGWFQLAFGNNGAAPLEWYRDTYAPNLSIPDLLDLAADEPIGARGLIARPEAHESQGLEAFIGHSPPSGHGARVRAILESTAASLRRLVDTIRPKERPTRFLATGGGARSDLWLQIKADLLRAEFAVPTCEEPACLGAAMLAAPAAGWFDTPHQAALAWRGYRKTFRPNAQDSALYADWFASLPSQAAEKG